MKNKSPAGMDLLTAALTASFVPAAVKAEAPAAKTAKPVIDKVAAKAARDAERALRFPVAAKQEAEAKAGAKPKAAPKGKTVRAATPKAEKPAKPKLAIVAFIPRQAEAGKPVFAINDTDNARPVAGTRLFAHTHAALTMMGMIDGKPAPKKVVLSVMGQRAVAYHLKERNFEDAKDHCLRLSTSGKNKFVNRAKEGLVDGALANGFMDLFLTGKVGKTGIAQGEVFQLA